jgi:hypothetical protein
MRFRFFDPFLARLASKLAKSANMTQKIYFLNIFNMGPRALDCTPKQSDSRERSAQPDNRLWPLSSWTLTGRLSCGCGRPSQTSHFAEPERLAIHQKEQNLMAISNPFKKKQKRFHEES